LFVQAALFRRRGVYLRALSPVPHNDAGHPRGIKRYGNDHKSIPTAERVDCDAARSPVDSSGDLRAFRFAAPCFAGCAGSFSHLLGRPSRDQAGTWSTSLRIQDTRSLVGSGGTFGLGHPDASVPAGPSHVGNGRGHPPVARPAERAFFTAPKLTAKLNRCGNLPPKKRNKLADGAGCG
jgi:hypothetical protein